MSLSITAATGDHRDVSEIRVRDEGNVSRMVTEIWVRDEGNAPRQVWGGKAGGGTSALTVTASPDSVTGAASSPNPRKTYTNATTATASGGVGPYTYAWAPDTGDMTVDTYNSATTTFSATIAGGESASDTFVCTATDALGNAAVANSVAANVYNFGKALND